MLKYLHLPIQHVQSHLCRKDGDFFYCQVFGGEFCWISRNQLYTEPFTDQDRTVVDLYCERHRLPLLLDPALVIKDLDRALSPSPPPAEQRRQRRWCCFKQ